MTKILKDDQDCVKSRRKIKKQAKKYHVRERNFTLREVKK
jgi:hypothetical protein